MYGYDKTVHRTGTIDVELYNGKVVSVWYRCALLPFTETEVDIDRVIEMEQVYKNTQALKEVRAIDLSPIPKHEKEGGFYSQLAKELRDLDEEKS